LWEEEEAALVARLGPLEFEEVRMRGRVARRRVLHFGWGYGYAVRALGPAEALPSWLETLRTRAAALADVPAEHFEEALVTRYPPGAGIGWHRDAPIFGSPVVGISLHAPCVMRLRRAFAGARHEHQIALARRSAYVLGGAARWSWQHAIPPIRDTRYSITFRTLRPSSDGDARRRR
jgi:alkylated DNA repair dioxygenase AlkB